MRTGWRLEAGGWRTETRKCVLGAKHRQQGMSLVAAIFLIVVVASLGAFAVRLGMGQHQTVNLALLSSRALSAANAGIEWSAHQALKPGGSCSNATLTLTQAALAGFTVNVSCAATAFTEGTLYEMSSSARYGNYGQPDYVSRTVRARFFQ